MVMDPPVAGSPVSTVSRKVDGQDFKESLCADLVIVADGYFSNFRNIVMGIAGVKVSSRFVDVMTLDARLPISNHGTVAPVKGFGPILLHQISKHDTRMLVDVKLPLLCDLKVRPTSIDSSLLTWLI